tara:strand:- start:122 stop:307 length:186 start_codon:yes stop_codon:yes gene_type:complete
MNWKVGLSDSERSTELGTIYSFWKMNLKDILEAVQDPSKSYNWTNWQEKCHLLNFLKKDTI